VPPPGSICAAVYARGCTTDEVAAQIAVALGARAAGAAGLIAALREDRRRRTAVVVDAVDEAADPFRLIV
jgi:hypothetical protein